MLKDLMQIDTLILGAGAAGLMCAAHAGGRVLVVDHARAPGEKIRISGGGRCNFTNLNTAPAHFLGENRHFPKSALGRYSPRDFLALVDRHGIAWVEKAAGQLFCAGSAREIVAMLVQEARSAGADLWLDTAIGPIVRGADGFDVTLTRGGGGAIRVQARHLVVATGGRSIPKMGATGLAHDIARQFGLRVTDLRPALVPLTFAQGQFADLAGVAVPATVRCGKARFDEPVLFTHRGLSGPGILQISSFWREGQEIAIALLPGAADLLRAARARHGRRAVSTELAHHLPARLAAWWAAAAQIGGNLADLSDRRIAAIAAQLESWTLRPAGTEGWRTAEVTLGGVATDALDARSMACRHDPQLFFIGEGVDVTGWLGGYNFQWAWASGHAAGQAIRAGLSTSGHPR